MISDMYKAFYGLNDNPFSIAPNPHYLFLSDRHREALAHLTYGLGETGGFVLLTGEVGTGKTTVSRCLLSQLPENTDTAFILNPSLSETDLLSSLCDELQIPYGKNPTAKQLTDSISQFLLKNHEKGRETVLIIDEAQHLNPQVLEQLRLLTNLETDTEKLMQVVLIGQPELQLLLKRQELRQLAQRISARYHLLPLTEEELGLYVQHRLQVAGRLEPLFTRGAIKELYRVTKGIPRLINLVCERSLMAGYVQSKVPIDKKMIRLAGIEILGKITDDRKPLWPAALAISFMLAFAAMYYLMDNDNVSAEKSVQQQQTKPVVEVPISAPITAPVPEQPSQNTGPSLVQTVDLPVVSDKKINQPPVNNTLNKLATAIAASRDLDIAYAALFAVWQRVPYRGMNPCEAAKQQGLDCFQQSGNWRTLENLNYPAIVHLLDDQGEVFFGTVIAKKQNDILLQLNDQQFWVDLDWVNQRFSGMFEIFWQPDGRAEPKHIGPKSSVSHLQWLETGLSHLSNQPLRIVSRYDDVLKDKIESFQKLHGLDADGIAGNQTLQLLRVFLSQQGPRLSAGEQG